MRAERARPADAGQVEAAHVLDRRAAALHEPAVGGDEPHLEHPVAERPVPEAPVAGQARRQHPADGGAGVARIEHALLARGAEDRRQLGAAWCPRRTVTVRSAGS